MRKFNKIAAQGDGLFILVDKMPENVRPAVAVDGVITILHSESGHSHIIDRAKAEVFEAADDTFIAYIRTLAEPAEVVHLRPFDTHETIVLEPNKTYQVRRQREWVPEGFRKAAD